MTPTVRLSTVLLLAAVAACDPGTLPGDPDADLPIDAEPIDAGPDTPIVDTCPVSGTLLGRSLVVNDPALLQGFSFARVMNAIRTTANVNPGQTVRSIYQAWMRTFDATPASGDCNDLDVDPNHFGLQCPRQPESKLALTDPFLSDSGVEFLPLALFNRLDLAPADGSNCGEYRIVYAMRSVLPNVRGRALIIFEGILPNPTPERGIDACLPVAQFWQALSTDPSPQSRAAKLERFYFDGTAVPGFPPVVAAHSYGLALGASAAHGNGQVRTNFFIDSIEWQLREFKLRRTCTSSNDPSTCRLAFEHVTVKGNPAEELFAGTHPRSDSFRSQFIAQLPRLLGTSVNSLALAPADTFNEYESVSSRADVNYIAFADGAMPVEIATRLSQLGSSLSTLDVLRRATTQTCAGCHQQSNEVVLGGGLVWPPSLEFVHIDENFRLSPALTQAFLPRRRAILEAFINARCAAPARLATDLDLGEPALREAAAAGLTLGGAPIGAHH